MFENVLSKKLKNNESCFYHLSVCQNHNNDSNLFESLQVLNDIILFD